MYVMQIKSEDEKGRTEKKVALATHKEEEGRGGKSLFLSKFTFGRKSIMKLTPPHTHTHTHIHTK